MNKRVAGTRAPSASLLELIDQNTGEISFRSSSGAIMTAEQYQARVRAIFSATCINTFTGGMAEDHIVRLLQSNTSNRAVGIIDRHTGKMPDIFLLNGSRHLFIEVKTVSRSNKIVLKEKQVREFARSDNGCLFAFAEHNLVAPKSALKRRGGRRYMSQEFRLTRMILADARTTELLYDTEEQREYDFQERRNGAYKNFGFWRLRKLLWEKDIPVREVSGGRVVLAGDVPSDILPDDDFCAGYLATSYIDCAEYRWGSGT